MSEAKQVRKKDFDPTKMGQGEDYFSDVNQSIEKYFDNVENYIPQYFQSIGELQQQYFRVGENLLKTNLALQKEFTANTGLKTYYSELAQKSLKDFSHYIDLIREGRETITLKNIELFKQFAKIWNENVKTNTNFNKNLIESWSSIIKESRKQNQ